MSATPPRCIVCGDAPLPRLRRPDLRVVRSPGCGLEWRDPFPDEDELRALYGADYLARWGAHDAAALERVRAMKHATYRQLFRELAPAAAPGRLLDVGCAAGFLLEVAEEHGYEAWGLDRSAEVARLARERFGERVHAGALDAAAFPGVAFDVVTLVDVLEHVPDPDALLAAIRSRLAPRGRLVALLPDAASRVRRLLGRRWPHYVPEHLYHWTPGSLERFLRERGWRVLALRTGVRKTFTGRYLASYAACVGSWLPPGVGLLGDRRLRLPTGEMLVIATPDPAAAAESRPRAPAAG